MVDAEALRQCRPVCPEIQMERLPLCPRILDRWLPFL